MRLLLTVSFLALFCGVFNAHAQIPDRVVRVGLTRPGELTPDREHYLTLFCDDRRSGGWVVLSLTCGILCSPTDTAPT